MDINSPVENPELVMKIHNYMSSQSDEDEKKLREALIKAKFLAPVSLKNWKSNSKGKQVLEHDVEFRLMSIQDKENNIYLPAFTDWNEISKWRNDDELKTIIFTFQDYAKIFMNNKEMVGLVINPYGENLVINKQQIEGIISESKLRGGETVKIGIPEKYPTDMSKAFEEYFQSKRCVLEAYLLLLVRENNEQSYLLVVETDEDVDVLYPELAKIATAHLEKTQVIDFISTQEKFGKIAIKGQSPFYKSNFIEKIC